MLRQAKNSLFAALLLVGSQLRADPIVLGKDLIQLDLGENFHFLDPKASEELLTSWGNPPGFSGLGMILPKENPEWSVVLTYEEDGYVSDEDADKIDYAGMLKEMQTSVEESKSERARQGYPTFDLVGWAEAPQYDAATHILYWAKHLRFQGENGDTLNYNIRVLGRKGVLNMNVVSQMQALPEINKHRDEILQLAHFKEGNRYADYNAGTDKLATYGLAALVAGGALAKKAGFFKLLLMGIMASKKFVAVGAVAVIAFVKKFFKGKSAE